MKQRIHIIGASGSGTSTLGTELANRLKSHHLDTDDYFWLPPKYHCNQRRKRKERQNLLMKDLTKYDKWVLSGSLCGWGDIYIPLFQVVIFLWVPQDIRIARLIEREKQRFGDEISPGGNRYYKFNEFIDWACKYDNGGLDMRSKATHEEWMKQLKCPIIRIEGDLSSKERIELVLNALSNFTIKN
jgi:adenylate kinase family enzyme